MSAPVPLSHEIVNMYNPGVVLPSSGVITPVAATPIVRPAGEEPAAPSE